MISYIIPTIGRSSLAATLRSIERWKHDEVIVVGETTVDMPEGVRFVACPRGHNWGAKERTIGIAFATGKYLAFIDDDDVYVSGHRSQMQAAMEVFPGQPVIFRMQYPNGYVLWREPVLKCGNVGTPMAFVPNDPQKLGQWSSRREGDFDFLTSSTWRSEDFIWRREIVALLGHNDPA